MGRHMSATNPGTATKRPHRAVIVGAAVAAFVLSAGSVAWACTQIMGQMTITPTSGTPGTVITTSAVGLKASPAKYKLKFSDANRVAAGLGCHGTNIVIKKGIRTTSNGTWSGVNATIPPTAPLGLSEVCGLESYPTAGQTGTTHQAFTVT